MRRSVPVLAMLLAVLAAWAQPQAGRANPGGPDPQLLRLSADEEGWRAVGEFHLVWGPDGALGYAPPTSAEYRVLDANGTVVRPTVEQPWLGAQMTVDVPAVPGLYRLQIRLEGDERWGPWREMELPFDNARPGPIRPLAPAGWVAPDRARIEPGGPAAPLPLSGVRGYAVTVDAPAGDSPCADPGRCDPTELARTGGGAIWLPQVPEGVHRVQAVAVSGAWLASTEVGATTIRVDGTVPEVRLAGLPEGWSRGPVRLRASALDRLSGMAAAGPGGPFTAIAVDGAVPAAAAGPAAAATVAGDGVHRVLFYARDAAGNVADGQAGAPRPASAAVRIDATPPTVAFRTATDPTDPERIEATVVDPLSGPAARGSIAVRPAGGGRFEPLPTATGDGRLVARWDSGSVPPGNYELRATAYDRAGNSATARNRRDGARMILAAPLKAPVALRFGFGGRHLVRQHCVRRGTRRRCRRETVRAYDRRPATRSARFGGRLPVSGLLRRPGGAPLAGRQLELVEAMADGDRRVTAVLTRADGSFAARLAPGPGRGIEVRFAGDRVLAAARGRPLRLIVRAAVRLRAPRDARIGGAPARFAGRVDARPGEIPRAGLAVELQFRLPGLPWGQFRTVRTDGHGRFVYPYAFSDDDSRGVRFLFRAHVPEQAGWPYAAGTSLPIAVTGR